MKKNYIKMNIDDNQLSLGNFCRLVKELSKNKLSAMQTEIFYTLFNVDTVNDTTINNYCVGVRSINDDYKQIFLNYKKKYLNDKKVLVPTIINLLSIMDGNVITNYNDDTINRSTTLNLLINKLYNISKNDHYCSNDFVNNIYNLYNDNNLIECLSEILFFIILDKKQPIYEEELKSEIIETVLNNTLISASDLQEYLNIKLSEEVNFNHKLKMLADSGNAYACFELGMAEYKGYYAGYPRYIEAFSYYEKASKSNHNQSYYMMARLYYDGYVGNKSDKDLELSFNYLLKAYELGSISSINLLGLFYLKGIHPVNKDINKALDYFNEAASKNYAYAYNNIGSIYESNKEIDKAIKSYEKASILGESWASNKLGEYYRINNDDLKAYEYYSKAINVPFDTVCSYSYYNLAKYYYLNGNVRANIIKNKNKALDYFNIASRNDILEAKLELLYYYANEYINNKNHDNLIIINNLVKEIENHPKFNKDINSVINDTLYKIKNKETINLDIIK